MELVEHKDALPAEKVAHIERLLALEETMKRELVLDDIDELTRHWHCNDAYVREFFLPKGHVVTGKIHRYACINILLKGSIVVVQSDCRKKVDAPHIYISKPGEKKALYALTDAIFLNVHSTAGLKDLSQETLEEHFIVKDLPALQREARLQLEEKA